MPADTASRAGIASPGRRRPLLGVVAVALVVVLLAALLVHQFVVQPFRVPSSSMRPTLEAGDVILADRTQRSTARPGEVVVLRGEGYLDDGSDGARFYVKRVIGVGGDRLTCCDAGGRLLRNGTPLQEPYLAPGTAPSEVPFDVQVPAGTMFVMGDDRAHSGDSRNRLGAPGGGMIPTSRVVGEVRRIVWPLPRARRIPPLGSP